MATLLGEVAEMGILYPELHKFIQQQQQQKLDSKGKLSTVILALPSHVTSSSTRVQTARLPAEQTDDKECQLKDFFFLLFSSLMVQPKERKLEN